MRIVLTALGSVGDVLPVIALASELRDHGHLPIFILPLQLLPYAQQYDFETTQLGPDLRETFEQIQLLFSQHNLTEQNAMNHFKRLFSYAPQALQQLSELCSNADLLISSDVMPLGLIVHELIGIPFVSVRVRYIPFPHAKRNTKKPDKQGEVWGRLLDSYRAQLGLRPIDDTVEPYGISPQLVLLPISRMFLPPNWELPKHYYVNGFFFLDEKHWQPDTKLATFLQVGPPPIVISLGSMMHDDPIRTTKMFVAAIEAIGCRAVIQQGWAGLAYNVHLSDTVHVADFVPHSYLFSKAAGVIHHGGMQTAAYALHTGTPTIIIPHVFEHLVMGQHAKRLGAACQVIPFQELSVVQLRIAIADLLENTYYQTVASALSKQIRAEQGLQKARLLIEQLAEKGAIQE